LQLVIFGNDLPLHLLDLLELVIDKLC
jgi:hypothetical protein